MDPIHPIIPTSSNIPPVSASGLTTRVQREHRGEQDPGQGAPDRRRREGREDYGDGDGDGFGGDAAGCGGLHVDVRA